MVLFKGKEANDRYGETLVKAGFAVEYIPVLRFDVHPEKVAKVQHLGARVACAHPHLLPLCLP